MNRLITSGISTALLSGLLLTTGCTSSDDSSGGGSAAVPANAILIDNSAVAESTSRSAVSTGSTIASVFGVEASAAITATDVLNLALKTLRNNNQGSTSSTTGVAFSDPCTNGGSVSGNETETGSSYNATATFNSCVEGSITLNGNFSVNSTFTNPSGPYTINASGNLVASFSGGNFGFNGFSFIESGDDSTGAYTTTRFTFAIDPSGGGGYAVQLTQPLVGNEFVSCELSSGQILVTGASGSQARATINSDGSAKIEYHNGDGNFIETANSPLACLI